MNAPSSIPFGTVLISLDGGDFIKVPIFARDIIADLKKRACDECRVVANDYKLYPLSTERACAISDGAAGACLEITDTDKHLSSLRHLADVGVTPGSFLLAKRVGNFIRTLSDKLARIEAKIETSFAIKMNFKKRS